MTLTELKTRVLQKLRVLESGETASTEDGDVVEDKYNEVYDELNNMGLVNWTPTGDLSQTHAQHVVTIVASRCADDFYVNEGMLQRLLMEEEKAIKKLKEQAHQEYIPPETHQYF